GDIAQRLEDALDNATYYQRSFFKIPGGFSLVTQLERINSDGTPEAAQRWVLSESNTIFSLELYIKRLLYADPGHYRFVVFAVTDMPFSLADTSAGPITQPKGRELLAQGTNTLPPAVAVQHYSAKYRCTALIYEFKKSTSPQPELVLPSPLPGRDHLV